MPTQPNASRKSRAAAGALLATVLAAVPATLYAAEAPWIGKELSGNPCEGRTQGYGPYDYTNPVHVREKLPVVEEHHFTPRVATLKGGEGSGVVQDLDYTLRAFPNHHPALYATIRLFTEDPPPQPIPPRWTPPECYLQRALNFAPEDARLYLLYGIYLHRLDKQERAVHLYRKALELRPESAETHYNLGLLLLELGSYNEARNHARKAYAQGYPLPGLRNQLAEAGYPL